MYSKSFQIDETIEILIFEHTHSTFVFTWNPPIVYLPTVWETSTGRCLRSIRLGETVCRVGWGPAPGLSLVAAAVGNRLLLLNPGADIGAHRVAERTDRLLEEPPPAHDVASELH